MNAGSVVTTAGGIGQVAIEGQMQDQTGNGRRSRGRGEHSQANRRAIGVAVNIADIDGVSSSVREHQGRNSEAARSRTRNIGPIMTPLKGQWNGAISRNAEGRRQ